MGFAAILASLPAKVAALAASAFARLRATGLIITGLALAVAVQTVRLDGLFYAPKIGPFSFTLLDFQGWHPRALAAESALADVKKAEPKAEAAQAAVNHQPAAITAAIASAANAQTSVYLAQVAAAAALHAVPAGRVCGASPAQSGAQHADLRGPDPAPQGDDDQAGSADMVSVAKVDWEKLNREAGLRAQLYQVGQQWIAEGVGVPDDDDAAEPAAQ